MLKISKRNLPHWELNDSAYFVTFNLLSGKLNTEEILLVKNHILQGNNKFYVLYAAIVINNHVHIIFQPVKDYSLSRIMKGIKGVSAYLLNKSRGTTGSVWKDESFDRILRDENEFNEKMLYMN